VPGWPELAFSTPSMHNRWMAYTHVVSTSASLVLTYPPCDHAATNTMIMASVSQRHGPGSGAQVFDAAGTCSIGLASLVVNLPSLLAS
jgi:hypothetical protein